MQYVKYDSNYDVFDYVRNVLKARKHNAKTNPNQQKDPQVILYNTLYKTRTFKQIKGADV